MAPTKPKGGSGPKGGSAKGPQNKRSTKPGGASKSGPSFKSRSKKPTDVKIKTVQQKTKSTNHGPVKKKQRKYTDKELGIPLLNSIKPAGIQKPHGMKKGKTFVDDKESMMAILAMVQADKEGNIESKMMRARQMEEIREARKAEAEKKMDFRKKKIEDTKDELRKSKKKSKPEGSALAAAGKEAGVAFKPKKKRVSFG